MWEESNKMVKGGKESIGSVCPKKEENEVGMVRFHFTKCKDKECWFRGVELNSLVFSYNGKRSSWSLFS